MRIFCWCDSPTAPTGFGRSSKHVLHALHDAGHELVQLAINLDVGTLKDVPWQVHAPSDRATDAYGLRELPAILAQGFDAVWTTFDPEVPFKYRTPDGRQALEHLTQGLRAANYGTKLLGWFPVDGGPLSDTELAVLGMAPGLFDVPVTMSPHVHDLVRWSMQLKGHGVDMDKLRERLRVIPHGVDMGAYRIPTNEERRAAKARLGFAPDQFVILQLERNQQRKQNYLGLDVLERVYTALPKLRDKVVLYQHMFPNEEDTGCRVGFNLPELAWRYGLRAGVDVKWSAGFVSEDDMVRSVYHAADVFLSTSTGEGFQYPAWEALACGVPVILPNDSARAAWLSKAPNAHLYAVQDRRLVMRGGYSRRMSYPDPAAAAALVVKAVRGRLKLKRERGRQFVEDTASLPDVQQQWVDLVAEQEQVLLEERRAMRVSTPTLWRGSETAEPQARYHVEFSQVPGLGDLVLAGPALRALRDKGTVLLRLPRSHYPLARLADLADLYESPPSPKHEGTEYRDLSALYFPEHQGGWSDPTVHRSEAMAHHLGVDPDDLATFAVQLDDEVTRQARARFLETFGVDLSSCVVLALESGRPERSLPDALALQVGAAVRGMGLHPVLVGTRARNVRLHGFIDMTGQTDLGYLVAMLEQAAAVVATDSGPMHFAAMLGTPLVACLPLYDADTRLTYYAGQVVAVTPDTFELDGERYPAGVKAQQPWAQHFKAGAITDALRKLMGVEGEPAYEVLT